jgi:ketosteroid isomerase-like protein
MSNVDKLREAMEAFNRRDGDGFDAVLADDAKIVPARAVLEGTVYHGPDAASQYVAAVEANWENLTWEVEEIRDCGNLLLALGRIRGCGRGSGARFDATAGWVALFRDGLVTSFHTHADRAKALEFVGMR